MHGLCARCTLKNCCCLCYLLFREDVEPIHTWLKLHMCVSRGVSCRLLSLFLLQDHAGLSQKAGSVPAGPSLVWPCQSVSRWPVSSPPLSRHQDSLQWDRSVGEALPSGDPAQSGGMVAPTNHGTLEGVSRRGKSFESGLNLESRKPESHNTNSSLYLRTSSQWIKQGHFVVLMVFIFLVLNLGLPLVKIVQMVWTKKTPETWKRPSYYFLLLVAESLAARLGAGGLAHYIS